MLEPGPSQEVWRWEANITSKGESLSMINCHFGCWRQTVGGTIPRTGTFTAQPVGSKALTNQKAIQIPGTTSKDPVCWQLVVCPQPQPWLNCLGNVIWVLHVCWEAHQTRMEETRFCKSQRRISAHPISSFLRKDGEGRLALNLPVLPGVMLMNKDYNIWPGWSRYTAWEGKLPLHQAFVIKLNQSSTG